LVSGGGNVHAYVYDDPAIYVDRNGKDPVIGAAVGVITGSIFGVLGAYAQGGTTQDAIYAGVAGAAVGGSVGLVDPSFGVATLAIVGGVSAGLGDMTGQLVAGGGQPCKPINWGSVAGAVAGGAAAGAATPLYATALSGLPELVSTGVGATATSLLGTSINMVGASLGAPNLAGHHCRCQ
jgi:hypothetical protein